MKTISIIHRELRALNAVSKPLDESNPIYWRIQRHLDKHHGILAMVEGVESDAINTAIGAVSSEGSWEHICGNADRNNCWPRRAGKIGHIVWYRQREWDRAEARAEEIAERMPDLEP